MTKLLGCKACLHDWEKIIDALQANWIWVPDWVDASNSNTAGKIVNFTHIIQLSSRPSTSVLHFSADTRYKLYVNGKHVAVGPTRSSPLIWYYDTLDIAPYLMEGQNELKFVILRYFNSLRSAMPFERTARPGLTVTGSVKTAHEAVDLASSNNWLACVDNTIQFPMGLVDDVFLHVRSFLQLRPICIILTHLCRSVNESLLQKLEVQRLHHLPTRSGH